jgi:hypothetical protein
MPFKIFDADSQEFPLYLKVVSESKLRRIQKSWWPHYIKQRRFLSIHDIYLMVNTTKHPAVRFYSQDIRYEVVYKRFTINTQHLYIPIEDYAKYYIDYKMRMAASVAEMLGVQTLKYKYNEVITQLSEWEAQGGYDKATLTVTHRVDNEEDKTHEDVKLYDRGTCMYLFVDPDTFEAKLKDINCYFIDSSTYDYDHDLRNLVRARLVGNLTEYSLKYELAYMSQFELKVAAFMYGSFGAALKRQSRRKLCVTLDIKFYRMEDLITTDNMNIDDNRCLQLILHGPSPSSYYEKSVLLRPNDPDLIFNFIERYLVQHDKPYLSYYFFLKIANRELLNSYIKNIKSLDDLGENNLLDSLLQSTVYASLLTFDEKGYSKLQKIYVQIQRQFRLIPVHCYNVKCTAPDCYVRNLQRVFIYIMRSFNTAYPSTPLTVELEGNHEFTKTLFDISTNLIVLPTFESFLMYALELLKPFTEKDEELEQFKRDERNVQATEGIRSELTRSEGIRSEGIRSEGIHRNRANSKK